MLFYVGTYTERGSEGIYIGRLDAATGSISIAGSAHDQLSPSFVVIDPTGRYLYAANEREEGAVSAYVIDPVTYGLTFLGRQATRGANPCHVSLAGGSLLTANYTGGSVVAFPVMADGSLDPASDWVQHTGSGVTDRQTGPHPHSVFPHPSGDWLYVPDLGLDRILIYRLDAGKLLPHGVAALAPGAGPRHVAFGAGGRLAYVINELDSTITAFTADAQTGALEPLQTVSALPDGFTGTSYCADIHMHPSGRFLYGSNRGHDSIAIFAVDPDTGALTPAGHCPTGGLWPRNFALDPSGQFVLAANQHSDTIVTLRIDQKTGGLTPTGQVANVPSPVCIAFR